VIKYNNLLLIILFLQCSIVLSQNYVEGVISYENESGEIIPLPGVTVFLGKFIKRNHFKY